MKKRILEGALNVYKKKGIKFTMDDLASELGMSKKTIYTVFTDKSTLLLDMVDYGFDTIKESELKVMEDDNLSTIDKLRGILGVMPETYEELDFTQIYILKGKYPKAYDRIQHRLESGWEKTLSLIDQGVEEGSIRPVNKVVFQITFEAAVERFLMGDELQTNKIKYMDALDELVHMLVDGITIN